jgi:phospholipid-binding lipoprotein MlaA
MMLNVRGEDVVDEEDYSLDNDYYDQSPTFQIYDPYENFNRKVYKFNKVVDKYIIRPPAEIYNVIAPNPAKKGVNSFISNLKEPLNVFYGIIQLKPNEAFNSFFRFFINSTFGILGIFDVAELAGLKKHDTSFGNVLKYYGAKQGPYIVLPILGPSNLRDGFGNIIDIGADPINFVRFKNDNKFLKIYYGTSIIVAREKFIGVDKILSEISLDEYAALRNFYYQKLNKEK